MSTTDNKPSGVRPARRTVVKGAAWAVPAVMVASAAPAFAQSGPIVLNTGLSCRDAADNQLLFVFNTTLPVGTNVTVSSWMWTPNDNATGVTNFYPVTTTVTNTGQLVYGFDIDGNSNGNLYICFSWSGSVSGSTCINTLSNNFNNCQGNPNTYPVPSQGDAGGPFDPPIFEWEWPGP